MLDRKYVCLDKLDWGFSSDGGRSNPQCKLYTHLAPELYELIPQGVRILSPCRSPLLHGVSGCSLRLRCVIVGIFRDYLRGGISQWMIGSGKAVFESRAPPPFFSFTRYGQSTHTTFIFFIFRNRLVHTGIGLEMCDQWPILQSGPSDEPSPVQSCSLCCRPVKQFGQPSSCRVILYSVLQSRVIP